MSNNVCSETISSGGCLVLAPGVLSAASDLRGTNPVLTGSLSRLLGFADQIEITGANLPSIESLVSGVLMPAESAACAGRITWLTDYSLASSETTAQVMRADPAYQQIDMNNATLGNPLELELTLDECAALLQTLNHHFADDGIRFECKDPYRWYCHFESPLQINSTPISASIGRDVASVRPDGADARRWRSKLAEIEMLLFEHPINAERQEGNKLPVNTLWLWGEGDPAAADNTESISINSDNFYTQSVSNYLGAACNVLPDTSATFKADGAPALIVTDRFTQPVSMQKNQEKNLQWFDETICAQLWRCLQNSGWPEVTIWCGDNRLFRVNASVKKQLLRRLFYKPKPLSAYLPDTGLPEGVQVEATTFAGSRSIHTKHPTY